MISIHTARLLRDAGLRWQPGSGDRFVVVDRGMDDEIFVISEMTVELHSIGGRPVIGFNGTTEWALDSVDNSDAVWLPRETQLRELLAGTFCSLTRADGHWRVDLIVNDVPASTADADTEEAYAQALLQLITGEH